MAKRVSPIKSGLLTRDQMNDQVKDLGRWIEYIRLRDRLKGDRHKEGPNAGELVYPKPADAAREAFQRILDMGPTEDSPLMQRKREREENPSVTPTVEVLRKITKAGGRLVDRLPKPPDTIYQITSGSYADQVQWVATNIGREPEDVDVESVPSGAAWNMLLAWLDNPADFFKTVHAAVGKKEKAEEDEIGKDLRPIRLVIEDCIRSLEPYEQEATG